MATANGVRVAVAIAVVLTMRAEREARADAVKCKEAIAKQAATYVQKRTKALQKCEDAKTKGKLSAAQVCTGEPKTQKVLGILVTKLGLGIAAACGGPDKTCGNADDDPLLPIGWSLGSSCPDFGSSGCTQAIGSCADVAACIQCTADAAVGQAIALYYGSLDPGTFATGDAVNKCQQAIGKATAKFLAAKSKALQKCRNAQLVAGTANPCPDGTASTIIGKAEQKKVTAICKACGGPDKLCDGAGDLAPATVGFVASCPAVSPPGEATCAGPVDTMSELVACVDCVTEAAVDCMDALAVPEFVSPLPAECNPISTTTTTTSSTTTTLCNPADPLCSTTTTTVATTTTTTCPNSGCTSTTTTAPSTTTTTLCTGAGCPPTTTTTVASTTTTTCPFFGCTSTTTTTTAPSTTSTTKANGTTTSSTSSSTTTTTTASATTSTTLPAVFVILMSDHDWSAIKGSGSAPFLNSLLSVGAHAEQYFTTVHPDEPNYLWLEAGDNLGITDNGPPATNHQATTNHLVSLLNASGISWKAYQEDTTGAGCPLTDQGLYAVKHDPFVFFDDVTGGNNAADPYCIAHVRPYSELASDLSSGTVARYNFITPNLCHDMAGSGPFDFSCQPLTTDLIKMADDWLSAAIPTIMASQAYINNGLILITWDEGTSHSNGPLGLIVLSPLAKVGYQNSIPYTHSSTLRTVQEILGATPLLRDAANATDLSDLFVTLP